MDGDHRTLGRRLQTLFGEFAEAANRQVGWVRRRRGLSAAGWVVLLVFGWVGRRGRCFADLAQQAGLSAQALQQRLTDQAVGLFRAVLDEALRFVVAARRPLIPLLGRFPGVVIDDSTQLPLPAALADAFPGCGGMDGERAKAGWKLLIRYDAATGRLHPFDLRPAKASDRDLTAHPLGGLARGALYLADLGYFSLLRLRRVLEAG